MHCLIIYQKSDGTKFIRAYNYDYNRKIGDETSMGWKVLNVLYEFEGNYYQHNKFIRLIREKLERDSKKGSIKRKAKKKLYNLLSSEIRKLERKVSYYIM